MMINNKKCIKCKQCIPYCPTGAIKITKKYSKIDQDLCVECYSCYRSEVCPTGAIFQNELKWPRIIRREISDPSWRNPDTDLLGRGTGEMKSNDVVERFKLGEAGFSIELGRPCLGTTLLDVEKVTMALAEADLEVKFEERNPCTFFMSDKKTGKFRKDIINERVLSIIVEFKVPCNKIPEVINLLKVLEKKVNTVFSVSIITRADKNENLANIDILKKLGYQPLAAKVNVGLGRPCP